MSKATAARMGIGSWFILIVLLSLLVATGVVIYLGWTLGNGTDVFYSSRKGYDEPPVLIAPEDDSAESRNAPETK
jgi:hypothetical protein